MEYGVRRGRLVIFPREPKQRTDSAFQLEVTPHPAKDVMCCVRVRVGVCMFGWVGVRGWTSADGWVAEMLPLLFSLAGGVKLMNGVKGAEQQSTAS